MAAEEIHLLQKILCERSVIKNQKWSIYRRAPFMQERHRLVFWSFALVLDILGLSSHLWAHGAYSHHPEKTMVALRVSRTPPKIDGVLDDEVWQHAKAYDDFTQSDPDEGMPPTEQTTVQVAYDDSALYVGIVCYDSEPEQIVARLYRRDRLNSEAEDWVSLSLDSHHDHQTGNFFLVGAAGSVIDGVWFNDTQFDITWDGVWEAKTSIHEHGWGVEYKIPYHVLRFSSKEKYIWGVNVSRKIARKQEWVSWVMVPRSESGRVSRFGHLEGIKGIQPPTHLEVLPFVVGRKTFVPKSATNPNGRDWFSSAGLDLRYGLSSNISLNATINPDFAQVEADPAVLNLTVFESFFEERRPFFIEGNPIFQTPQPDIAGIDGPSQFFYTRRIGKQPGRFPIPDESRGIDWPNATTILGAAKVSGKTAGKTSFGIVEAVTANEYATIERTFTDPITGLERTERGKHRIEPLTNFFIGRVQQDVRTNSTVGAMVTAANREGLTPAYTAGVDGNLKWSQNTYSLFARLAGSRMGTKNDRANGYEALAYLSKLSGWIGGQLYVEARSKEFDINDLGFMNRASRTQLGAQISAQRYTPWALARRSGFNINVWSHWTYDGINLVKGVDFHSWHDLKNYWWFHFGISREFESLDDLETRGGPPMVRLGRIGYWLNLATDNRKSISLWFLISGLRAGKGLLSSRNFMARGTIRLASNIQFEIGSSYRPGFNFAQWVTNIDNDGDRGDNHYVFGELKSRVLDVTTRANVAFTTNLTLQLYLQSFVAVGDFSNLKELARPASYEFTPYALLNLNPDFSRRELRGNLVLRWEYRPGSTLFLVWSQSRSTFLDFDNPSFHPFEGIRESFTDKGENVFLIKLNSWMGM